MHISIQRSTLDGARGPISTPMTQESVRAGLLLPSGKTGQPESEMPGHTNITSRGAQVDTLSASVEDSYALPRWRGTPGGGRSGR